MNESRSSYSSESRSSYHVNEVSDGEQRGNEIHEYNENFRERRNHEIGIESSSDEEYVSTVEDTDDRRSVADYSKPSRSFQTTATTSRLTVTYEHGDETPAKNIEASAFFREDTEKKTSKKVEAGANAPFQYPLLIRKNAANFAKTVQLTGIRPNTPIQFVKLEQIYKKQTAGIQIVPSLECKVECTETVPSFAVNNSSIQFVVTAPIQTFSVLVLPEKQKVKKGELPRKTAKPQLLLAPEGPNKAEVLRPEYRSVTPTIALGKHVAVEFTIPNIPKRPVRYYKAIAEKIQNVAASTLYRTEKKQQLIIWKAAPANQLVLSTVEKGDPMIVQKIQVEQNPKSADQTQIVNMTETDITATSLEVKKRLWSEEQENTGFL